MLYYDSSKEGFGPREDEISCKLRLKCNQPPNGYEKGQN